MEINLFDLQNKRAKPAQGLTISDHAIDLAKFTGSELILTGKGTRGMSINNSRQVQVTFKDFVIDMALANIPALKFGGVSDQLKISGSNAAVFGKAGSATTQLIFILDTWSNVEIGGLALDHRRGIVPGSLGGGASLQFKGVLKAGHSLGKVVIRDMVFTCAQDEAAYVNHNNQSTGYVQGEDLLIENCKVYNSGRDFFQQWGFNNVTIRNCYGENGGIEANADHCSALSMNGDTENLLVENCEFKNVAQLIYSGKPSSGKSINALFKGVKYTQGTHAGARGNQIAYIKGPGKYTFHNCDIDAPNVKEAALAAESGAEIVLIGDSNKINAPKISRWGTPTIVYPEPVVTKWQETIDAVRTVTYLGEETIQYFRGGKEVEIKAIQ